MKKINILLASLVIALALGSNAFAKMGVEFGASFGILPDCAGLGATILDDGLKISKALPNLNGGNIVTGEWGYNEIIVVEDEQSLTDMEEAGDITNLKTAGPMMGMDFGLQARFNYSFFFFRTGFNYTMKVAGGEATWKAAGIKQEQVWDYSSWHIPFTLGINVPVMEDKVNVYMGITMAVMSGGWEIALKRTTLRTSVAWEGGSDNITGLGFTGAEETPEFKITALGLGYVIGVDAEIYDNIFLFIEYEAVGAAKIDTYNIKDTWFTGNGVETLSKTTILGGSFIKFGGKYKLWL